MSDTPAPDPYDPHSLDHLANAHAPLDGGDGDIASPLADTVQATATAPRMSTANSQQARKILQASRARRPHSSARTGPISTSTSMRFSIQTS